MFGYFFEIIWLTEIFFHLIIHCPQVPQGYKGTKVRKLSPVASITVSRNSLNQTYLWHNAMMIVSGEPGQPGLPGSPGEPGLGKSKKNIEIRWIFTKYIMKKKDLWGLPSCRNCCLWALLSRLHVCLPFTQKLLLAPSVIGLLKRKCPKQQFAQLI